MANNLSLKDIVEKSFDKMSMWIELIRSQGHPFEYTLNIDDSDYPLDFNESDETGIGNGVVQELILNSLKSLLQIREPMDIDRLEYDQSIFDEKVPHIGVDLCIQGGLYRIVVTDNGPGIISDDMNRIWQPGFSRRKSRGLGLPGVGGIIERDYEGSIYVASIPDKATSFTVYLPVNRT